MRGKYLYNSHFGLKWWCIVRLLLNPIFFDWQSNPNPSQICDWQSKSKSDFQNELTIQSKSNYNPTIFGKRDQILNGQVLWCNHGIPKFLSTYTLLINQLFENFEKKWLGFIVWAWFEFFDKIIWYFGFGLKWQNRIDNPNPKSNFVFVNPDWAIQQSNPAIPCV